MRHTWTRPKIMIYLLKITKCPWTSSRGSVKAQNETKCCKQGQFLKRKFVAFIGFSSFGDPQKVYKLLIQLLQATGKEIKAQIRQRLVKGQ